MDARLDPHSNLRRLQAELLKDAVKFVDDAQYPLVRPSDLNDGLKKMRYWVNQINECVECLGEQDE